MDSSKTGHAAKPLQLATLGAAATAVTFGIGYLVLVMNFAVNIPLGDEWDNVVPFVHEAIHHNLAINSLWLQHSNPSHLLIPNAIFIMVGVWGQFNTKILIGMSALLQFASFICLIGVFRLYSHKKVTAFSVAVLGLAWFSLGGIDNALWGFQLQIYLTVFFLVLVPALLALSREPRRWSAVALVGSIICAVAASLCTIQGLVAWPVGLLVLLWAGVESKRQRQRIVMWCATAIVMIGAYLIEYKTNLPNTGCQGGARNCSVAYGLQHPGAAIQYLFALLGNLSPARDSVLFAGGNLHLIYYQLLGGVWLATAVFVAIASYRDRNHSVTTSLPFALISIGVLWDITIAVSRVGVGLGSALESHYATPQVFVLSGILMVGLVRLSLVIDGDRTKLRFGSVISIRLSALIALGVIAAAVIAISTAVGIDNARFDRDKGVFESRVVVNLDRLPASARSCYLDAAVAQDLVPVSQIPRLLSIPLRDLQIDRLSVFSASDYQHYRKLGPPIFPSCNPHS